MCLLQFHLVPTDAEWLFDFISERLVKNKRTRADAGAVRYAGDCVYAGEASQPHYLKTFYVFVKCAQNYFQ